MVNSTSGGLITTLAGTGVSGTLDSANGTAASFGGSIVASATGLVLCVGLAGTPFFGSLIVADSLNHRLRLVGLGNGSVSTYSGATSPAVGSGGGFADGPRAAARYNSPSGLALRASTGDLFISDTGNFCLRVLVAANASVVTAAGRCALAATAIVDGVRLDPHLARRTLSPWHQDITELNTLKVFVVPRTIDRDRLHGKGARGYRSFDYRVYISMQRLIEPTDDGSVLLCLTIRGGLTRYLLTPYQAQQLGNQLRDHALALGGLPYRTPEDNRRREALWRARGPR